MRKPYQSPGRMKNSSYCIALVGDRTHDLPHTVASNMVKVSHALKHSAMEEYNGDLSLNIFRKVVSSTTDSEPFIEFICPLGR